MARDDPLDDGKPDAGAFELPVAMQPLEHAKQLVRTRHVKTHAVFFYPIDVFAVSRGAARLDGRFGPGTGIFDGVGDKQSSGLGVAAFIGISISRT